MVWKGLFFSQFSLISFKFCLPLRSFSNQAISLLKERYVLVLDIETTSLPVDSNRRFAVNPITKNNEIIPASDPNDWPHAVQFSYILYDNLLNESKTVNEIIKLPEGVTISPASQKIHKISMNTTQSKSKRVVDSHTGQEHYEYHPEIQDVIRQFMADFRQCDVVVAHNMQFDRNILLSSMQRLRAVVGNEDIAEFLLEYYANTKEFCTCSHRRDLYQIHCLLNLSNKSCVVF